MELYLGSNVEVKEPAVLSIRKTADFGMGFYTTSSLGQAQDWAIIKAGRRGKGVATVSTYNFDYQNAKDNIKIKEFPEATEEWLDFVVENRTGVYEGEKYDLVIGPVADDKTITVIDEYIGGAYPKKMAIELLEPQNLTDQYAFLTKTALHYLNYTGVEK